MKRDLSFCYKRNIVRKEILYNLRMNFWLVKPNREMFIYFFMILFSIQRSHGIDFPFKRNFKNSNLTFKSNESLLLEIADESVRFFLTSDFGGMFDAPFITHMQLESARLMGQIGSDFDTHFQFALGDNFYEAGVTSVNDTRFIVGFFFL